MIRNAQDLKPVICLSSVEPKKGWIDGEIITDRNYGIGRGSEINLTS